MYEEFKRTTRECGPLLILLQVAGHTFLFQFGDGSHVVIAHAYAYM